MTGKKILKDNIVKYFLKVFQPIWEILVYNVYAYYHLFFVIEASFSPRNLQISYSEAVAPGLWEGLLGSN